jgi:hypothetical protein
MPFAIGKVLRSGAIYRVGPPGVLIEPIRDNEFSQPGAVILLSSFPD